MKNSLTHYLRQHIGRHLDSIRCRYDDCSEVHPTSAEDAEGNATEQITCTTCRKEMGLPPLDTSS